MQKLIFATNNQHKVDEIKVILNHEFEIISLKDAGINIEIPEPHDTLEKNASEKSFTIFNLTNNNCFSEDTGLEVFALNGEPGVKSARYADENKSFVENDSSGEKNIAKLLSKLKGIHDRKAQFRTIISLIINGKELLFEGICKGTIIAERRGKYGFGYDSVFVPDGAKETFGEMSLNEKIRFSHRKKAAEKLAEFLKDSNTDNKKDLNLNSTSNYIPNENDLIQGCLAGDRKMQELLYQRFSPKMYAVCLRYSGNPDDAQDLLQEGFIKIFRNLDKYRGDGSFEGWIRRIFVNTSIEHYRKKINLFKVTDIKDANVEDKEWNVLDALDEKDIINMVQELSPGYRAVFNMHVIEGYSHKEIGDILKINEGTSKSQLARAKVVLKKMLEIKLSKETNIN